MLGLSLAQVIGGLARWVELRRSVRIGWLTPLLGLLLVIDLTSFWGFAWEARGYLAISVPILLGGVAFASSYYVAAYLVFPREITEETNLDDHFFNVRRIVVGTVLAANIVELWLALSIPAIARVILQPIVIARLATFCVLLLGTIFIRGKKPTAVVLGILVAWYFLDLMGAWNTAGASRQSIEQPSQQQS